MEESQEKLNPYFVTGLVDGEGSFTYWIQKNGFVQPRFELKMNIGDKELVESVQRFFGVGDIYFPKKNNKVHGRQGKVYVCGLLIVYRVCRIDELLRVLWHFVEYPLCGKKRNAFKIWKEIVFFKKMAQDNNSLVVLAKALTRANGGTK